MSTNRKGMRKMANGRYRSEGSGPLTTNTTIQLSLAVVILAAVFSGAWWSSGMTAKMDALATSGSKLEVDMANVKNDVNAIKYDVKSVQTSVNQISSETIKRK